MVKRSVKYLVLFVAGLSLLGIALVAALAGTETGSRWLLSHLVRLSPVGIQFAASEGRLADHLVLHEFVLDWGDAMLNVEEVDLEWSPWSLLFSRLDVAGLHLEKPVLKLSAKSETLNSGRPLSWPEAPGWLSRWQFDIAKTTFRQGRYVAPQGEPLVFDVEANDISLNDGIVTVRELRAGYQDYSVVSALRLNLFTPQAAGEMTFTAIAAQRTITLSYDLRNKLPAQLLVGPVSGRVLDGGRLTHQFNGRLSLGPDRLDLADLDIEQIDIPLRIAGAFNISWRGDSSGASDLLHGEYNLSASGPELMHGSVSGDFSVEADRARIAIRNGTWLGSKLAGDVQVLWAQERTARASFEMRGLDPSRIAPQWNGLINLTAVISATQLEKEPRIDFEAQLLDSLLRGLPLVGVVKGGWQNDILSIAQADFSGDGFHLAASGSLADRLNVDFEVRDLSVIETKAKGQLKGTGWFGSRGGEWVGRLSASGESLHYDQLTAETFSALFDRQENLEAAKINLALQTMNYGVIKLQNVEVALQGSREEHEMSAIVSFPEGTAQAAVRGKVMAGGWQGMIRDISITHSEFGEWALEAPSSGVIDKQGYALDAFNLAGDDGRISLSGRLQRNGIPQQLKLLVEGLPLPLITAFTDPLAMTGALDMDLQCDNLSCIIEASGVRSLSYREHSVAIDALRLDGTWNQQGLSAALGVKLPGDGYLSGTLSSKAPLQSYEPIPLQWAVAWRDMPLLTFAYLPERLNLDGTWRGYFNGILQKDSTFRSELQASLVETVLSLHDEDAEPVMFMFEEAVVEGGWQGNDLTGSLKMVLAEHGRITSSWKFTVPARWPVEPDTRAGVTGQLNGHFTENGLIGILWPELVQDTRGEIEVDTRLDGTWGAPKLNGELRLRSGHAYIPVSGITLNNVEMKTLFSEDRVVIENLAAESAPGKLSIFGTTALEGWHFSGIDLKIKGKDFTLIDLPELRVRANPDLALSGEKGDYAISGKVEVPYFLAVGRSERSPVQVSADAVIVGQHSADNDEELPFNLKTNIKLILGEQVLVNMFGLNARLGGQLALTDIDRQHFTGSGLIKVEEGSYSSYGVKLKIERGEAHFAHGPLDNPVINILALKKIGETKAGVQIDGTAKAPRVKLYSEPAMADTDILSLIVLGRPLDQAGGDPDPLMLAAGALLSASDSVVLKNQLQNKLGLDTISAESESGESEDTILRVGKYLTPDLYLSYGYALFGQRSEAGLRYRIYKGWEAESKFGLESGADLYYRFEFD